jgi:lysophospholipase L1-like esterase
MTTLFLAGDSTVAPPVPGESPLSGWGGYLHEYVDEAVDNRAIGGATTASFIAEGRWDALIADVRAGDSVLIQFGHNDQKQPALAADGGYRANLRRFVTDVLDAGGSPVLLTSAERRLFVDTRVRHSHGAYPAAVRALAAECSLPLIDLTVFTAWLYEWLGPDASRELFVHFAPGQHPAWPDGVADNTHFQVTGARVIAAFVARSLAGIRGEGAELDALGVSGVLP